MDYILEKVIADRQVNLIAGGSGSGKSRFLFQLRHHMLRGEKLLGYQTGHCRWGYMAGDRTGESIHETLEQMGMKGEIPVYSCVDKGTIGEGIQDLWSDVKATLECVPTLLVVDGFTSFCPNGKINDYDVVAKWLGKLQNFCQTEHVSIVGSCHTTKNRAGEEITDPRQKIAGSVAWAAYSEGVIVIDKPHQGGPKDAWRDIYMCGRNSATTLLSAKFNTLGWLELREGDEERERISACDLVMDGLFPGCEFKTKELELRAKMGGISRSAFYRWLGEKKERGELLEGGRGVVVVPHEETQEVIQ